MQSQRFGSVQRDPHRIAPESDVTGQRGDLIAEVQVVTPKVQDEKSKELLRDLGALNDHDIRKDAWR